MHDLHACQQNCLLAARLFGKHSHFLHHLMGAMRWQNTTFIAFSDVAWTLQMLVAYLQSGLHLKTWTGGNRSALVRDA